MKQTDLHAPLRRYGPAAFMTVIIPVLSLLPAHFFRPLAEPLPPIPAFDKLVHALLYAALTASYLHAATPLQRKSLKAVLQLALAATAYGLLMEVGQKTLSASRSMDPLDAGANMLGALACAAAVFAVARRRKQTPAP